MTIEHGIIRLLLVISLLIVVPEPGSAESNSSKLERFTGGPLSRAAAFRAVS